MSAHCQRPVWPGIEALLLERPRSTSPKMYTRYLCLPVPTSQHGRRHQLHPRVPRCLPATFLLRQHYRHHCPALRQ